MKNIFTIAAKDIRLELRTKKVFNSMFIFSIIVLLIFSISFDNVISNNQIMQQLLPALLWVAFIFTNTLGMNRSFADEKENGCLDGLKLVPVDSSSIYFGKTLANVILTLIVEIIIIPIFIILFNFNIPDLNLLLLIIIMGTIGFNAVGTLLAALTVNTRTREILLPVLLLPLLLPVLIPAILATSKIFAGQGWDILNELRLIIVYDMIFLTISSQLFEYVLEG